MSQAPKSVRHLVVVCGDQLDIDSTVFEGFDPQKDAVLMTEAHEEATYVWQHKRRLVFFFAAMRAFRDDLTAKGFTVLYNQLDDPDTPPLLGEGLSAAIKRYSPDEIILARPGDYRVLSALEEVTRDSGTPLRLLEEAHFLIPLADFNAFREGRKRFILEDFYRFMRRRTGYLMDGNDKPVGGEWNFDKENRDTFGKEGPGLLPRKEIFPPSERTSAVIEMVADRFPDAPGSLDGFDEPVTRSDALAALDDFINNRLPDFGRYQDAIRKGTRAD